METALNCAARRANGHMATLLFIVYVFSLCHGDIVNRPRERDFSRFLFFLSIE